MNTTNPQWRRGNPSVAQAHDEFVKWERRERLGNHVRTIAVIVLTIAVIYGLAALYQSAQNLMHYTPQALR